MYAPLCDENGGIINDPVILRLAADRFWLSIADSDVLLWVKGIAYGRGFDVRVFEPDVSPLAIQGPKADDLMSDVVGEHTRDIGFFRFVDVEIAGTEVLLARSGWSGQGGFEIYLQDSGKGPELWDVFWEAGQNYNIRCGGPNLIDRLEKGLKSYGNDMTIDSNPFESGLDAFVSLHKDAECMSRTALLAIEKSGPDKKLVNLIIDGAPLSPPRSVWNVLRSTGENAGIVTSQAWSPTKQANLAFAIVASNQAQHGNTLTVDVDDDVRNAIVHNSSWQLP
jgi:dimethylsulfoniopropionate demethylase